MNAWSSPPQPGMCHWLGVVCWKTLSDRNFWFICVHIKKKKEGNFGCHHITEIFHCLDLVFRSLEAEWWLKKLCCRVEAFLCLVSCAKWLPLLPLRTGKRVLPAWPGVRAAGGKSSSQKLLYEGNAKLSLTSAASLSFTFFTFYLFIIIRWGGAKFADGSWRCKMGKWGSTSSW